VRAHNKVVHGGRSARWLLVVLGACSKPRQTAPAPPGTQAPPLVASAVARLDDAGLLIQPEETGDLLADERRLLRYLHAAVHAYGSSDPRVSQALGVLAALYERRARWDEYGVMRGRMLDAWAARRPADAPPGPPPGGPWMAPGVNGYDSEKQTPPTLLSRWMNRRSQPELYSNTTTFERIVQKLDVRVADAVARSDALGEAAACDALASAYAPHAEFGAARKYATRSLTRRSERLGPRHPDAVRARRALEDIPDFEAP
jgi:hypothetical protein